MIAPAHRCEDTLSNAAENGHHTRTSRPKKAVGPYSNAFTTSYDVDDLAPRIELVIETVPERLDLKLDVLNKISRREPSIIASNTSALSIDQLSEAGRSSRSVSRPSFFQSGLVYKACRNCRRKTKLVTRTLISAEAFTEQIGRQNLVVKNIPGFATSRLDLIASLEAMRMLEGGRCQC